jgi:soluble lytic murein transglycosylase-like protein
MRIGSGSCHFSNRAGNNGSARNAGNEGDQEDENAQDVSRAQDTEQANGPRQFHRGRGHMNRLREAADNALADGALSDADRDLISQYLELRAQEGRGFISRGRRNSQIEEAPVDSTSETGESERVAGTGSTPGVSGESDLDRWDDQVAAAAESTGLPANFIKATLWAESRGNPDDPSQNPDGQHTDLGVMQISDYTYGDVMQNQPDAPRGLQAANPDDNVMMGAWELKDKLEAAGGDYVKTSEAYRGVEDGLDNQYANWVQTYWKELDAGEKLSDF